MLNRAPHQSHALTAAQLGLAAGLVLLAVHSLFGLGGSHVLFDDWLSDTLMAGAAALCLSRFALIRE